MTARDNLRRTQPTSSIATSVAVIFTIFVVSFVVTYRISSGQWPTADWVGAVGTWFGGIATATAVIWSVRQFTAEQKAQQDEALRRDQQRWQRLTDRAKAVEFSIHVLTRASAPSGGAVNDVTVKVKNRDPAPLVDVIISHPLIGEHIQAFTKIEPHDTTASKSFPTSAAAAKATSGKTDAQLDLKRELNYSFWLEGVCWIYRTHDGLLLPAEDRYEH